MLVVYERRCSCSPFQDLECWISGRCDGVTLSSTTAATESDCLDLCKAHDDGCAWFTFHQSDSLCVLLEDCPVLDAACTDCWSGQVQCAERAGVEEKKKKRKEAEARCWRFKACLLPLSLPLCRLHQDLSGWR